MERRTDRRTGRPAAAETGSGLEALRSSGAVQTAFTEPDRHESNEHLALIYETRAEQFATAIPFVRQGLERGEKCIYVVDDSTKSELLAAMRDDGIDVETARETGGLTVLGRDGYVDGAEFTPDGQLASLAGAIEAATAEHSAARVAVEMTCFLDDDLEYDDLIAYEERYNELSAGVDAIALCQYNRERFPDDVVRDAVRAHPHLIADGTLSHNVYYTPPETFFDADRPSDEIERMTAVMADLARAETELKRQNERLEEFANIVSHELRNPLNVARGRLDIAREEGTNEHLETVARAHERMESLIADLLALARAGDRASEFEPIDLAELVVDSWRTVPTTEATLVTDTDGTIRGDPARLRQFFENLLQNAVEHGGEDVTITVGDLDGEAGFYVEDDGPGIPEEDRDRVFEGGYSTTEDGTGFGLSIVEEVADAHGWTIDVTEGEDGGARFEIVDVETAE